MTLKDEFILEHKDQLIAAALKACRNAYAPYSHFQVGAAVLCENGEIFTGCNVENASYGATLCAERNAVAAAIANGNRKYAAVTIVASDEYIATPCGICRQVLSEFGDITVLLCNSKGVQKVYKLTELLPEAFKLENK